MADAVSDPGLQARRQFIGFAAIGVAGFVVDASLLTLGLAGGLSSAAARAISVTAAIHATFAGNRLLVFRDRRRDGLVRQWAGYIAANGVGALCNYLTYLALTATGAPVLSAPAPAFLIAAVVGLMVNFAGSRRLAFRPSPA